MSPIKRERIRIGGIVQGVGFRPFVYRIARGCNLSGFVRNDGAGVTLEIEGDLQDLVRFHEALEAETPPMARITGIEIEQLPLKGEP